MSDPGEINAETGVEESRASGDSTGDQDADETGAEQLPLDVIFDILKNRRRRLVLRYARENEGPYTLSDIAEYIAAIENDKSVQQLTSDERKRVYVGLYQCHLPRMNDTGVLDFDRNRGTVEMNASVAQLEPYLNANEDETDRPWPLYYGAVTAGGLLLFVVSMIPAAPLSLPVITLLVLCAVGCCSIAHVLDG